MDLFGADVFSEQYLSLHERTSLLHRVWNGVLSKFECHREQRLLHWRRFVVSEHRQWAVRVAANLRLSSSRRLGEQLLRNGASGLWGRRGRAFGSQRRIAGRRVSNQRNGLHDQPGLLVRYKPGLDYCLRHCWGNKRDSLRHVYHDKSSGQLRDQFAMGLAWARLHLLPLHAYEPAQLASVLCA